MRRRDARLAHGDERRDPFARDKVIHDVSSHLGRAVEEAEKLGVVALRQREPDREGVRDGVVARLLGVELCERRVELCRRGEVSSARAKERHRAAGNAPARLREKRR